MHPARLPDSQRNTGMPELQRLHDEDEGTNRDSGLQNIQLNMSLFSPALIMIGQQ